MFALASVLLELGAFVTPNGNEAFVALANVVVRITVGILDGHKEGVQAD